MLDPKIETFLMICKYMNFTKAAEELHLTQPAVSSQMKKLDEYYGGPLFAYENKQLRLTDIGRIVYQSMKQMENREIYLQKQIHYLQNKKRDIKFGATMTIGEFLLSNIIDDYLRKYPDSSLHMQVHNTQTLLEKLDNAELDFAFIEGNFSKNKGSITNFVGFPIPLVALSAHIE